MTLTSVAQANSKTAEFARLFDLFDRVATRRRTRALAGDTSEVISADDIANFPAEFVPVLKNLSTILSMRALHDKGHERRARTALTIKELPKPSTDAPSKAVKTKDEIPHTDVIEETEEDVDSPTFPLDEHYPFTFKLMLHKLYDLDEWAKKVKNAVETSRSQFKPLAERFRGTASSDVSDVSADTQERAEIIGSNVRPVLGTSTKFKPPSTAHPHSTTMPFKPDSTHVLKKRCIGRRKSIDGPMSGGVWVYDAAISAAEVTSAHPVVEITLSAPRNACCVGDNRVRHQSSTTWEEMQGRGNARQKIKVSVPLLSEEVSEPVAPHSFLHQLTKPGREVVETGSVLRKRRSIDVLTPESCKAVKRPLCV